MRARLAAWLRVLAERLAPTAPGPTAAGPCAHAWQHGQKRFTYLPPTPVRRCVRCGEHQFCGELSGDWITVSPTWVTFSRFPEMLHWDAPPVVTP